MNIDLSSIGITDLAAFKAECASWAKAAEQCQRCSGWALLDETGNCHSCARISPEVTEILYGTPVPVTRKIVELGQPAVNGDIVLMSDVADESDIWQEDGYPYDEEYERFLAKQESILKTRERRRCYQCGETGKGLVRRVLGHTTVSEHFDPTLGYRLVCGHTTIDC